MPQALPGVSASSPPSSSRANGLLRLVSPAQLNEQDRVRQAAAAQTGRAIVPTTDLGAYIRRRWMAFRNHRNTVTGSDSMSERLLAAQRAFDGRYSPDKLAAIQQFGGSEVYMRITAAKCRAASALLRDVYLGPARPWDIQPQPDPPVPPEVQGTISQLVAVEVQGMRQAGQPIHQDEVHMRYLGLMHAAQQAARRNAKVQSDAAADKVEDILVEGNFYHALAEFIVDLPQYPFACLKGPEVRMVPRLTWANGTPSMQLKPQMFWARVSPFNIYWTPGANSIEAAEVIERLRMTRSDLNDCLGLPGYDQAAVRGALDDYGRGLRDWLDAADTEFALGEGRENPNLNQSHMIDALLYTGNVQGKTLIEEGMPTKQIPDPDRDYLVQSWVVGRYTIKTQLSPSPRQRHNYFITSYEKSPGGVAGNGIPDILADLQDMGNATARALVNNMSISSGPQVVINDDAVAPGTNTEDLYPWKRWHVVNDPFATNREPVTFFQPASNAQEMLAVYQAITGMADEASAIPRYLAGAGAGGGGAGRTASGLSMLMGNAEKVLQNVAANIDLDVMEGVLNGLYDMIMLTDRTGLLTGEESIRVRGVNVAVQKETERQKQLQFLQITANPIDAPIIGEMGRARVLRSVASNLGLPDDVVPDDNAIQAKQDAMQQASAIASRAPAQPQQSDHGKGGVGHRGPSGPTPGGAASGGQGPAVPPTSLADHAPPQNNFQQSSPKALPGVS